LEVQRLKDRMPVGIPSVHKDLSMITRDPMWRVTDAAVTLEEFISTIESTARIDRWEEADKLEIALLNLAGSDNTFYKECSEIHADGFTWQKCMTVFRNRYKDVHTDQYHYMKFQTARQAKGEDPQAFDEKCMDLARKIICKVIVPVTQRIPNENSERMLLASFVTGLVGNPENQ